MKIIVRVMGLTIIGLCISLMLMHSFDLMVRYDELNKATALAMSNTQLVAMESVEDAYYHTNNARKVFVSDEEYLQFYESNLNKLISTNSTYEIIDYYADARKGLLYVNVACHYQTLMGQEKTLSKKLLNIIEVDINNECN